MLPKFSYASDTSPQMYLCFAISQSDFTIRKVRRMAVASTISTCPKALFNFATSLAGMRRCVSEPIGTPIRPCRFDNPFKVSDKRLIPSSSGLGEVQMRTSSIQLIESAFLPMLGITAIGLPSAGRIRNQGRVGLCQKLLWKPAK